MSDSELIRSYPHPVLRPDSDDFIDAVFRVDWDEPKELPNAKYEFVFTVTNTCKEIRDLIAEGKAIYMLRFVCKTTLCRKTFTFSEDICRIQLSLPDFLNDVIITPMIVSLEDIENYSCEAFHPDYRGLEISVQMGDVLGIGNPLQFDAPTAPEVQENPESIIRFVKSSHKNPPKIQINDDGDCIYILAVFNLSPLKAFSFTDISPDLISYYLFFSSFISLEAKDRLSLSSFFFLAFAVNFNPCVGLFDLDIGSSTASTTIFSNTLM